MSDRGLSKIKSPSSLFRKEALAYNTSTLFDGTVVTSSKASTILTLAAVALAVGLILTLIFGTYARKERVLGYVVPSEGLVRVVAPRAGAITRLEVEEGQEVEAGQASFSISSPRSTTAGLDADAAQVAALEREQANIESQIVREAELAAMRSQDARRRITEYQRQLKRVQHQQSIARQRVGLLNRDVERLETLQATGHIPVSLLDEKRGELLDAQQSVASLAREVDRLYADIAGLEAELVLIPIQSGGRQDELRVRLMEVERFLTEAEVQREVTIRAPVSGRVTTLVAHAGLSVTPNQAMLAILPIDGQMRAELLVPTHAAGFIRPGQEVRLRYDAFPHQKFGLYRGVVHSVSHTVLNPEEQTGPVQLQMPAYRVIVTLDAEVVTAYGEEIPLQPGLTLQADIVRERMRIIEWIFDPVRAAVKGL